MVVNPLKGPRGVNDQKRTFDRTAEGIAIVEDARVKVSTHSVREVVPNFRTAADDTDAAGPIARQCLGNPSAENAVAAQDRNYPLCVRHSGSIHPS